MRGRGFCQPNLAVRRVLLFSVLAIALGTLSACADSSCPPGERTRLATSSLPGESWAAEAARLSPWYLRPLCGDLYPVGMDPIASPSEFQQCVLATANSVGLERKRIETEAYDRCVADTVSTSAYCCFERWGVDANLRLDRSTILQCSQRCAASTGRPPTDLPPPDCHTNYVAFPPMAGRFRTPAVVAIERECIDHPEAAQRCQSLSTGERRVCLDSCGTRTREKP